MPRPMIPAPITVTVCTSMDATPTRCVEKAQCTTYTDSPMKAVLFHAHGGPEVLQYEDVPDPQPGYGEVLIEVRATSVNHVDIFLRRGMPGVRVPLPKILGCDAAGII